MSVCVAPTAATAAVGPPRDRSLSARASTVLLAVCALLAMTVGIGAALGYRGEVVLSGSMRPALEPGDMLVARRMPASDIRPGQVISFAAPSDGRTLTHRVVKVAPAGATTLAVTTRGDANNTGESWRIAATGQVAEVVATIPKAGYLTRWAANPESRVAVFAVLGLLMLALGLRWVWRP